MRMSLSRRLIVVVACSLLGLVLTAGFALHVLRSTMLDDRKEEIRIVLNLAARQVEYYQSLEQRGVLPRSEAQRRALEAIDHLREGQNLYIWVRRTDGMGLILQTPQGVGKIDLGALLPDGRHTFQRYLDDLSQGPYAFGQIELKKAGSDKPVLKINGVTRIDGWNWVLGFGVWTDDVESAFWHSAFRFMLLGLGVLLMTVGLAVALARSIYRNLGGEPEYAARVMQSIADGDISTSLVKSSHPSSLLASMARMQESLRTMIEGIQHGAAGLGQSASRLSAQMRQIDAAAQESEGATASTAAAVEQLAVSIDHIATSARQTEQNSVRSSDLAARGESMVTEAAQTIDRVAEMISGASDQIQSLLDRSKDIGSIANVIKEIADQTNLLALNAAIEAARAGEQGRGFAVVADEVRNLAERTTRATDEISQMIHAIQSNTESVVDNMQAILPQVALGVDRARSASDALLAISREAEVTLGDVQEVTRATAEQSQASASVAQNIERIAQMIESSALSVRSANAEVAGLEALSGELRDSVARFQI
jgi:methyl-accepting chemotaxis protein